MDTSNTIKTCNERKINSNSYVDVEWCTTGLKETCGICGCKFEIDKKKAVYVATLYNP